MEQNEIQKSIIQLLQDKKDCAFGNLVKELKYSYAEVLENVLELKSMGKIAKMDTHNGNYVLSKE